MKRVSRTFGVAIGTMLCAVAAADAQPTTPMGTHFSNSCAQHH
jgi:hypothetical protein